ncbi:MAG: hypothetical protein ACPGJV_08500 [Bacteriovoracaceae bacterium]
MKYLKKPIFFFLLFTSNPIFAAGGNVLFESFFGFGYGNWDQTIDTDVTGTIEGDTFNYHYGLNLQYYLASDIAALGVAYRIGNESFSYSEDSSEDGDDSWAAKSSATSKNLGLALTLQMTGQTQLKLVYFFSSSLEHDDHFIDTFGVVEYEGKGFSITLQRSLLKSLMWTISFKSMSYADASIDGESVTLPGAFSDGTLGELSNKSLEFGLALPIRFL